VKVNNSININQE